MFRKTPFRMKELEIRHLKKYCYKHGIDTAEIDSCLTYEENREHLKELIHDVNTTKFEPIAYYPGLMLERFTARRIYEEEFEGRKPPHIVENNGLRYSLEKKRLTGFRGFSLKAYTEKKRAEKQSKTMENCERQVGKKP